MISVPKSTRAAIWKAIESASKSRSSSSASALHDAVVGGEALLDLVLGRGLAVVVDVHDLGRRERASFRQLEEAKPLAALDDDVQPPVVEALEHLDHAGARADLAHAVVVREHEPELLALRQALADQLR